MNGPYEYKERPELIEMCLNCEKENCPGYCEEYYERSNRRGVRLYAAWGEKHTLTEWARMFGKSVNTLYSRMRLGLTLEQALTKKNEPGWRKVKWQGEWITLVELAKRTGVPYHRLADRLKLGWSVEDAVTKPKRNSGPRGRKRDEQGAGDQGGES